MGRITIINLFSTDMLSLTGRITIINLFSTDVLSLTGLNFPIIYISIAIRFLSLSLTCYFFNPINPINPIQIIFDTTSFSSNHLPNKYNAYTTYNKQQGTHIIRPAICWSIAWFICH